MWEIFKYIFTKKCKHTRVTLRNMEIMKRSNIAICETYTAEEVYCKTCGEVLERQCKFHKLYSGVSMERSKWDKLDTDGWIYW